MTELFGALIRRHREAAGLTLRDVAKALRVSHVFLIQVERGDRRLAEDHWPALLTAIPSLTVVDLVESEDAISPLRHPDPDLRALAKMVHERIGSGTLRPEVARQALAVLATG